MTILSSDIKILGAERPADDADSGGFMTATVVVDGLENNIFNDVSSLERTVGKFSMRKVFVGVQSNNADTYLGAHIYVAEQPADPASSVVMVGPASSTPYAEMRAAAVAKFEAASQWTAVGVATSHNAFSVGDTDLDISMLSPGLVVGDVIYIENNGFHSITAAPTAWGVGPNPFRVTVHPAIAHALAVNEGSIYRLAQRSIGSSLRVYGSSLLTANASVGDYTVSVDSILSRVIPTDPYGPMTTVDPAVLGISYEPGTVPGFSRVSGPAQSIIKGDVCIVHHTITEAPQSVTASQDINLGRTRLADVRVYSSTGVEITTGFTVNKSTGHIVFSTNYTNITIKHRIEDMLAVQSLRFDGVVTFNRAISHAFPAGETIVSAVLVVGDLKARVHLGFQQSTMTAFSDAVLAPAVAIVADYNEPGNPIVVTNKGAITERWALQFTNTTTFNIIGEQVGIIGTGNTGTNCAPVNPATGVPYFTIPAAGWGTGWSTGNVYRFNTEGAVAPVWLGRSTAPSDPYAGQVKAVIAARGDIDAS